MSAIAAGGNVAAAGITGGYGLYNQLSRYVAGDKSRVHFVVGNIAVVQFDAVMSETHVYQASPTQFPLENGSTVSDHIVVAPIELQLVGAVADNPAQSTDALENIAAGTGINYLSQRAGALGTLASTAGFTSLKAYASQPADSANATKLSRSAQVYNTLRRLAGYAQVDDFGKPDSNPIAATFDVVTAKRNAEFCRFSNMSITSLQLQRDQSTGSRSLIFAISLQEVRLTYSQQIIQQSAQGDKSKPMGKSGERAEPPSSVDKAEARFKEKDGASIKRLKDWIAPE